MKVWKHGTVLIFLAATTALSVAASPGSAASGAAPDGYAATAKTKGTGKAAVLARKDDRMRKCKAMTGDEKKACEADAKSVARKAVPSGAPVSSATMSGK